jgi:hypothetical protein
MNPQFRLTEPAIQDIEKIADWRSLGVFFVDFVYFEKNWGNITPEAKKEDFWDESVI